MNLNAGVYDIWVYRRTPGGILFLAGMQNIYDDFVDHVATGMCRARGILGTLQILQLLVIGSMRIYGRQVSAFLPVGGGAAHSRR